VCDNSDDYPRRKWARAARDEYVTFLIDRLRKLEQRTDPKDGQNSAKGKDLAAFEALSVAGELVNALAGWALDHQVGLALKNLEFVPLQPSGTKDHPAGTKDHPEYLAGRKNVDDHVHEKNGSSLGALDPIAARKLLINLLRANSGGFHPMLQGMAIEALEALDYGEVQPMLAETKGGDKRTLAVRRLELRAIAFVEYRYRRGSRKYKAQQQVADALGVEKDTIKSWELRLRTDLGDLAVSRTISLARNAAQNEDDAQKAAYKPSLNENDARQGVYSGPPSSKVGAWESQYGADALRDLAVRYKEALRQS
jgi:hypothetical protein